MHVPHRETNFTAKIEKWRKKLEMSRDAVKEPKTEDCQRNDQQSQRNGQRNGQQSQRNVKDQKGEDIEKTVAWIEGKTICKANHKKDGRRSKDRRKDGINKFDNVVTAFAKTLALHHRACVDRIKLPEETTEKVRKMCRGDRI